MHFNGASDDLLRLFEFEHVRYIFNDRDEQFVRLRQLDEISTTNQLIHAAPIGSNYRKRFVL